jgi:hypothetical protein
MVNDRGKKSLPPYVSYRTFRNFIDGLQMGMPARIDRSYWGERLSGSTGTQLMTALRFLGLIDNSGMPTTRLRQLVSSRGQQRSEILKQIAHGAFDFLSERSLDPQIATYSQLEEAFYDKYQVTGDVARKCIKFLISLESDAGVSLSPFITKRSKTARASGGKKGTVKKTVPGTNRHGMLPQANDLVSAQTAWYEMVLAKFPTFDPAWSDEVKLKWFDAFDSLLKRGTTPGNGDNWQGKN